MPRHISVDLFDLQIGLCLFNGNLTSRAGFNHRLARGPILVLVHDRDIGVDEGMRGFRGDELLHDKLRGRKLDSFVLRSEATAESFHSFIDQLPEATNGLEFGIE